MSPRTRAQNEHVRLASRTHLMDTALHLFARFGYERTTVKMIAAAAGVSTGLLYNYFAGKEVLLHAIFERSMDDVRASFALAEREPDPRARVGALVRGAFDVLRRHEDFWRLSYDVRMQPAALAGVGERLHEWTGAIRGALARYLRDAGVADPELEALVLFALVDGASQHYVLDRDGYPLDRIADAIAARFAPGVPQPDEVAP
jgi:AcrR family transcriptional regulator